MLLPLGQCYCSVHGYGCDMQAEAMIRILQCWGAFTPCLLMPIGCSAKGLQPGQYSAGTLQQCVLHAHPAGGLQSLADFG